MTHRPTLLVLPLFCAYTLGVASSLAASVLFVRCKSQGHCPAKKGGKKPVWPFRTHFSVARFKRGGAGPTDAPFLPFSLRYYPVPVKGEPPRLFGQPTATAAAAVDVASKGYILYAYILTTLAKELTYLFHPVCISF